jgi:hypothetical protein
MQIITTENSYSFSDYSQLSYEDGIWVLEEYDLDSRKILEQEIRGSIIAIVNIN